MTLRALMVCLAGLAAGVFPLSAGAGEMPARGVPDRVVIAVESAFPPWSLPDGSGAANAIVREAFRRQGVEVTLDVVPYARCRRAVITGEVVACLSMGATPEIRQDVLLPAMALTQIRAVLMVRGDTGSRPPALPPQGCDPSQWSGSPRLGMVNGYDYPPGWSDLADSGAATVVTVQSETAGLRMLGAGRLDGMVLLLDDLRSADGLMQQAGMTYPLQVLCPLGGIANYIGFSAIRADALPLLRRFENGYLDLEADGTLDAILQDWRRRAPETAALR